MKYFLVIISLLSMCACKLSNTNPTKEPNKELAALFDRYYEERMKLFPLEATFNGDNRYNNLLTIDFTDSYRNTLREFYTRYLTNLRLYKRIDLNRQDRLSYDVFKHEMDINLEALSYHDNYFPFNQFYALPLTLGQLGSGDGSQPFKTTKDYENWIQRASHFPEWTDSAIAYFRKGMESGWVLPKALVVKMIPQMQDMAITDTSSLYYNPVKHFPDGISTTDQQRLAQSFKDVIEQKLAPSFKKLASFLQQEYLPKARTTSGVNALPGGEEYYRFLIRQQTTTNLTPDEIYQTGVKEVERISKLQDSVKNAVGFKGTLQDFFKYMVTDPDRKFKPYKTPDDVLNAFRAIQSRIEPHLKQMFNNRPKIPFEIRQTEAYRAASASAEYMQGSPDGSRPGIFYVPILDATNFNTTSGMESLFLHEAIPGHHYQISLQMEDTSLPKFRRFGGNNAYVEGWALYCESLGKELGLYTDPYQYMAALGDEMHRAIRLVVDVAIHTKGMTREEAIKYMMSHEAANEQYATMEIERYMAIPGQALSYKLGSLKIAELRSQAQRDLGNKFNLADFHDQILKDGPLPLDVLEMKIEEWAMRKASHSN